jgi:polyphenol oxidase
MYRQPSIFSTVKELTALETTRHGGVSQGAFSSLNMGNFTDDKAENIIENRRLVLEKVGFQRSQLAYSKQIHDDKILSVNTPGAYEGYDALMTQQKDIMLAVTIADCTPILIYDTENQAIAAIHAGWKGTVLHLVSKTLHAMQKNYNTQAKHCKAYIGTCIEECDFEVGEDVAQHFHAAHKTYHHEKNKFHVNLKAANQAQLIDFGIPQTQIQTSPYSTASSLNDYFSHRAEKGNTGRMMAMIGIKSLLVNALFLAVTAFANAQTAHLEMRKADKYYEEKNYQKASETYQKAESLKKTYGRADYNQGNALYKQNKKNEATNAYERASQMLNKPEHQSQAYYNLGNIAFEDKNYDKAIENYKKALKVNPSDLDTKKNLTAALLEKKKQEQQQKQQNKQQNQNSNQQNQQQQNPNQQNQEQTQQQQQNSKISSTPQQQQKPENGNSKESQAMLLRIAEEAERQTLKNQQKTTTKPLKKSNRKDW